MTSECTDKTKEKLTVCCRYLPARYVFAAMAFFGTYHVYLLRVNLSVAIVAMVDYEGLEMQNDGHPNASSVGKDHSNRTRDQGYLDIPATEIWSSRSCGNATKFVSTNLTAHDNGGKKFLWDANMQGLALGSYFYGYICSQGVSYPTLHGLMSMWAPPTERGKMLVIQFAGSPVGSAIALPLCGYLASTYGWESSFYVTGASGIIWTILLVVLVRDSPSESPTISVSERQYIEKSLQQNTGENNARNQLKRSVPWKPLLTSIPVWSTVVPHFSTNFGTYIFLTMLPIYLHTVLNIDVKSSGVLSSIPYISKICLYPIVGFLADYALAKGIKATTVRKAYTSIATFTPGLALISAAYTGCNLPLLIFFFSIPDALDTFAAPGYKAAMIEMAPAFAGIIFAIANTIANASGFLAPQIAGALREYHKHNPIHAWNILFWLGAAAYIAGGLVFLVFGTSELQDWTSSQVEAGLELEVGENEKFKIEESSAVCVQNENNRPM